jgi:uncharacterized protein YcfJ
LTISTYEDDMKMHAKLMMTVLGVAALPLAHAVEFEDYGRVIRVSPRVEQVRQPRQECRTDYVQQPVQQPAQRSAGGAIIGGIAGALLGNQVGGGSGRAAATAAGAIGGALVGDRVDNDGRPQGQTVVQEQAVRQCRNVDAYESRTVGYDVTYDYHGRNYTSVMQRDPGQRVRLRVNVEPESY